MEIKNAEYLVTAVKSDQYPNHFLSEVALIGRSNVGKSSLINSLARRKNLARVAATPGKTRLINFYNLDNRIVVVDLPGYGYARVSKAERRSWGEMIETYLNSREQLNLLLMLVDIRHPPSADDHMMAEWLKCGRRPYLVIATKVDKLPRQQVEPHLKRVRSGLGLSDQDQVIPFSAVNGQGREEIWQAIRQRLDGLEKE